MGGYIVLGPNEMAALDPEAAERGRLMAARAIFCNPEARRRVEDRYGIEYCRKRWPEAYPARED